MKEITQWEHFKKNYLWVFIFMIGMGITAIVTMEPNIKWISSFFFLIAGGIVVGNYLSWKKKP